MLEYWGVLSVVDEVELAVTELATNVIKHVGGGSPATLVLEARDDALRVELHDTSHAVPDASSGGCDAECGRGLHLLSGMCAGWGTLVTATGKAVWCEIALEPTGFALKVRRAATLLDEYRRAVGQSSHTVPTYAVLEESAAGLIADLLHWLSVQGGDPDGVLDRAQTHFEAEVGQSEVTCRL
jgi:hypothetical protein